MSKPAAPPEENPILWRIPELFPHLNPKVQQQLKTLHTELVKHTRTINLVPTTILPTADVAHFADCILASQEILKSPITTPIYDISLGNGFPGLILAILDESKKVVIVERDSRKCEYLKQMATVLDLKNVVVEMKRLEDLPDNSVQCAVSRGFASVTKTIMAMRRLVPKGGLHFHMKGDTWGRELAEIPSQLCSFWEPTLYGQYEIPIKKVHMALILTKKIA